VVKNAVTRARRKQLLAVNLACQRTQSLAQLMQCASGPSGENAVMTATKEVITTFSGAGSGLRSHPHSMAVASAKTVHQHMNLMKRIASLLWYRIAQSLALVIGASLTNALPRFHLQEASFVVEAQKRGHTSSLRRRSLEVKNAATSMETRMHRTAAIGHVKCLALASSPNGAIVAPRVVEGPSHESLKSRKRQSMVAQIALIIMATKRLRHVAMTHALFLVKDLGANGPNAVKNALTVRATVPLVRSRAGTLSL
jgi:hypothetical protein